MWSLGLTVYICANNLQVTVCVAMCFKYRLACRVVLAILREAASRGPSALADILVNLGGHIHSSGMAEATVVKFGKQGDYQALPKG